MCHLKLGLGGWAAWLVCLGFAVPASAQLGELKSALEKKGEEAIRQKKDKDAERQKTEKKQDKSAGDKAPTGSQAPSDSKAAVVFSKSPINPAKPKDLTTTFKTGEYIYGLIRVEKTWRALLRKGDKEAETVEVPLDMIIDGKTVGFQYITIKQREPIDSKILVLDIAPKPEEMTAYKDPAFTYAEGKGRRRIGPDDFTYELAKLEAGKHTVKFQVRSYGDVFAAGEFTIDGDKYKFYEELREKVLKEALAVDTMPKAGMTNKDLEAQMRKLLENAGWKNIERLVIYDKDWWLERVEGGDSPIKSRYIGAAAAAKADDGSYFWCKCTFQQIKQIDGSFGPLELEKVWPKRPILKENVNK